MMSQFIIKIYMFDKIKMFNILYSKHIIIKQFFKLNISKVMISE